MSWDLMNKAKEEGGSSLFVKLKDGDSIEGTFVGEPYCYYQKFKDKTEHASWSEGLSFKFKINFVTRGEDGNLVAKILNGGVSLRDQLLDAKEEYGLNTVYKIKRTGSGKEDTRYAILFKASLTDDQMTKLTSLKLNEFSKKTQDFSDANEDQDPFA